MRWNLPPSSNRIFENRAGAMDETPEDRIRELEAENARLEAEVERLREQLADATRDQLASDVRVEAALRAENIRLRADLAAYERTMQTIATLPPQLERVRHVKSGGIYEVLGEAQAQVVPTVHVFVRDAHRPLHDYDSLTVYRCGDGKLWVRFTDEFRDGRFEPAPVSD